MKTLLDIKDLNVYFRSLLQTKHILKDVSLEVNQNEILAIVGESGSGKSVTVNTIMGLLGSTAKEAGSIKFYNKENPEEYTDILSLTRNEAQKIRGSEISMIFQDPLTSLNPLFKIGNQIAEAIVIHQNMTYQAAINEAKSLLDLVRVPGGQKIIHYYPYQLSGGMRQRIMIAMALACRPKLLIADEPTTALDVTIQAQILALIKDLQKQLNMGVIFITHDMSVVAEIADRVSVMYKGEIVETGTVKELFLTPQHRYTQALLKAVPDLGSMHGRDIPHSFPVLSLESDTDTVEEEIKGTTVDYTQKPVLEVKNLHVAFKAKTNFFGKVTHKIQAVRPISFDLYKGETLGIVGESGSGKSTVGNAILGLLGQAKGEIQYKQRNILDASKELKEEIYKDISFIFQDPLASLNPRITIGTSIEEPMLIHNIGKSKKERQARVKKLLEQVEISPSLVNHYPHEFSGGMLQRVNIARALATEPKVIIADESVAALDVSVQAVVLNLMMRLQKKMGMSYIFISHDMSVIERMCHRVMVMTKGQLVETGTRREIFEDTRHSYTKALLNAIPVINPNKPKRKFSVTTEAISNPIYAVGTKLKEVEWEHIGGMHSTVKEK